MIHILWSFLSFSVALGVLTTVHELGHFIMARICNVKVERFSIGFGKSLWKKIGSSGTEYVLALIPLGGYVKMLDEKSGNIPPEYLNQTFDNKKVWQRAIIIIAGPISNLIFAIAVYWLAFFIGVPGVRPVINEIIPNSIAYHSNILPEWEVKSIGRIQTSNWDEVRMALISKIGEKNITIELAKFKSNNRILKTLDLTHWKCKPDKQDPVVTIGIIPCGPKIQPVLSDVRNASAAQKAGLQVGDKIIKINHQLLLNWATFIKKVKENPNKNIEIEIERNGKVKLLNLIPDSKIISVDKNEGFVGITPTITPLSNQYKLIKKYSPLIAFYQAINKTWQLIKITVSMIDKLVTGDVKINSLGGPIAIAQGAGISAEYGLVFYLMFLALISINLGVINLLPLPVLDGGHLLFLVIEKLQGVAVSARVQDFIYRIFSILLILLMIFTFLNDLSRF
ncbi:sigma E protease regulator RseP [Candidatus Profftia sp. (ex Adelges kitamiensis)]|uniref:sigma E protease regulator RseP n=1 Tax=Candidatus Profftia sp. (ex Adelges kitamiensis) TaxID=2864218 RepID=UPI001CE253EC|nr:sigma E protease regulator RseP [Candidatus Profftia sp. (ex Adelges kitamiensis)]